MKLKNQEHFTGFINVVSKKLPLILIICALYLTSCGGNSDDHGHDHNDGTHEHDNGEHNHGEEHQHDDNDHEQEDFKITEDSTNSEESHYK